MASASAVYLLKSRPMKALHFLLHEIGGGFLPQFPHVSQQPHIWSYPMAVSRGTGQEISFDRHPHTAQPPFEDACFTIKPMPLPSHRPNHRLPSLIEIDVPGNSG
jgi:hypothetical protein